MVLMMLSCQSSAPLGFTGGGVDHATEEINQLWHMMIEGKKVPLLRNLLASGLQLLRVS